MKILLFIILFMCAPLFAQNLDWSNVSVNFPTSKDDTTSTIYADAADTIRASNFNEILRMIRLLQDKVGLGTDTPSANMIFIVNAGGDSTTWTVLTDALIPDDITVSDVLLDSLAQSGATSGQVAKWNGSIWAPANDATGAGGSAYADSVVHDGRNVIGDSLITDDEGVARFEPLDAAITKTDEAEVITANWQNTDNPWADNEVANDLTATNYLLLTAAGDTVLAYLIDANIPNDITITKLDYVLDDTTDWHTAYGWGDWSTLVGYITDDTTNWNTAYGWGDWSTLMGYVTDDTTNWDAAFTHVSSNGSDHAYLDQSVVSGSTPTFLATNISDGGSNAIITTTQETNFGTAYTHSQDNTQAHSDYLLNSGDDETSGIVTAAGFITTGNVTNDTTKIDVLEAKTDTLRIISPVKIESTSGFYGLETLDIDTATVNDEMNLPTGAVDAEGEIANDMLNSQHYVAASIDNEHLADDAVGVDELATDAVTMDAVDADGNFTTLTGNWATTGTMATGVLTVTGVINTSIGIDAVGDTDLDYGSADVDDHTFTTDGTGTAEFVIPEGSIDGTEILDNTVDSDDYAALSIDNEHLAVDIITADEMADADHGDVTWSTGVAAVDSVSGANAVDSDAYVDASIDNAHLADNAVGNPEMADNAVEEAEMHWAGMTPDSMVYYIPILPAFGVSLDSASLVAVDTVGMGYASHSFTVDSCIVTTYGPTPNFTFQIVHGSTDLFASAQTKNAANTTKYDTFDDAAIVGGSPIYIHFPAVTTKPKTIQVILCGRWR